MSLDSAQAVAPLQYEAWHELRVKADPLSWSSTRVERGQLVQILARCAH